MTASRKTKALSAVPVRCAIYTRKSTEEGLDQDFNSLDAQREAAEAYIKSQAHEGWVRLPERYDDGGFTGGNMGRPALARLLADIETGRIDAVIVYKVDRLSRSLLDFDLNSPAAVVARPCWSNRGCSWDRWSSAPPHGGSSAPASAWCAARPRRAIGAVLEATATGTGIHTASIERLTAP